ncbi:MAG: glycoside hydrolase family 3 C-terminal domain-containing protein, partial [Clostridia bacterium]|nr:glycoside hydrolase family 3 C-terminal domain-containing protein [Clostridia bacterium]
MSKKEKKPFSLKKEIILVVVSVVVAVALAVGNYFALIYESVINVYFSSSDYEVSAEEEQLCQDVEAEGIVLLKNEDNALPLASTETKVALMGQDSVDFMYGGGGSGSVNSNGMPTLKDSMEAVGLTVNTTLWNFYDTGAGKSYRKTYPDESGNGKFAVNEVPQSVYTDTVKNSMTDDVAIVSFGRGGGESSDLPTSSESGANYESIGSKYLELDANELACLKLACEKYDKVIVLINSSNAMELDFLDDPTYANVKAALWVGAVGETGMYAIGEVITGKVNPSGRLADTYAYDSTSAPSFANFGDYRISNSNIDKGNMYIVYEEGIYVGYRYYETRYEDSVLGKDNVGTYDYATAVQYPFGYGLSYTTFAWSDYSAESSEDGKTVDVSITVTNTGNYPGKDVVELYVQAPYYTADGHSNIEKSSVVLVGYAKTDTLDAKGGENCSQTLDITVDVENFASYDYKTAGTYVLEAGQYYLAAGRNAHDALNNILESETLSSEQQDRIVDIADASDDAASTSLVETVLDLSEDDTTTYAVSQATGYTIKNQLSQADVNSYEGESVT